MPWRRAPPPSLPVELGARFSLPDGTDREIFLSPERRLTQEGTGGHSLVKMGSMRRAFVPLRALLGVLDLLLAGLAGLVGPAAPVAYAEDAGEDVVETVLSVDGTPEPDEGPVRST